MQRIKQLTCGAFVLVLAASGLAVADEPEPDRAGGDSWPPPSTGSVANDMDDASAPPPSADPDPPSSPSSSSAPPTPPTPGGEPSSPELDLSRDEIERLQRELASRGLYRGPIDGMAGPQTMAALREFHQQMGAPVDSGLDEQTRRALGLQLDKQYVSGDQTSAGPGLERPVGREGDGPDVAGGKTFRSQVQLRTLPPDQVGTVQTRLKELGLYPGPIDGKFGEGTRSALQRFFQTHAELASRGIITDTGAGMLGLPPRALDMAMNAQQSGFDSRSSRGQNGRGDMNQAGARGTSSQPPNERQNVSDRQRQQNGATSSPEPGATSAPRPSGGTNVPQPSGSTPR